MDETIQRAETAWKHGRFDAGAGRSHVLFGRMYEDASIERRALRAGGRVFCIASAGCTAIELARDHEVVAVDINPVQLAYAERRLSGAPVTRGSAERLMGLGRAFAPLLGWKLSRVRTFLELSDPVEQIGFWREHLDTRRFRIAFDALLSGVVLRTAYSPRFLGFLPEHLGAVLRGRMERCFARHPNRVNPYARALLLGDVTHERLPRDTDRIRLVHADAAAFLEREPACSFDGFTLSNILDGTDSAYGERLFAAVKRVAAPGAVVVLRSFGEPQVAMPTNCADEDRAMLWGTVDVKPAAAL